MPPIDYFKPLDNLRSLAGTQFKQPSSTRPSLTGIQRTATVPYAIEDEGLPVDEDPSYQLLDLQKQRRDEIANNAAKGLSMAAPGNSLHDLDADIESNPLTQQGAEVNDYLGKLHGANQAGFSTPQEQAVYNRNLEAEKLRQPLEIAKTTGQFGVQEQETRNKGLVDTANIVQGGRDAQLTALQTMLSGGVGVGDRSLGVGTNGIHIGPRTNEPRIPSTQLTRLNKAREEANKSNLLTGIFGNNNAKQAFQAELATVLSQHPANAGIKSTAQEIANHPRLGKLPLQQILQDPSLDLSDATPDEINQLGDLLSIIRGF